METVVLSKTLSDESEILPGIYHHYKGGTYWVFGTAYPHDQTSPDYVIYTSTKGHDQGRIFLREREDFKAIVTWPDGVLRQRFVREGY